jgi:hypothetical protein
MRSEREAAEYMLQRYGKDASIHCSFSITHNSNETARQYWRAVLEIIYQMERENTK